uniref:Uncharacterized protein n=1 Tax=Rhizophora mucronata TaxID=61149 RepID=A0A2P2K9Y2_RHIMU
MQIKYHLLRPIRTFSNKMPRHTPSTRSIFNWKTQYIISIEMYVNQI